MDFIIWMLGFLALLAALVAYFTNRGLGNKPEILGYQPLPRVKPQWEIDGDQYRRDHGLTDRKVGYQGYGLESPLSDGCNGDAPYIRPEPPATPPPTRWAGCPHCPHCRR